MSPYSCDDLYFLLSHKGDVRRVGVNQLLGSVLAGDVTQSLAVGRL